MNNEGRVVVTHHVEIVRESWREKSLVTTVMKYVNCKSKVLPRAGGIISIHLSKKGTFRYTQKGSVIDRCLYMSFNPGPVLTLFLCNNAKATCYLVRLTVVRAAPWNHVLSNWCVEKLPRGCNWLLLPPVLCIYVAIMSHDCHVYNGIATATCLAVIPYVKMRCNVFRSAAPGPPPVATWL